MGAFLAILMRDLRSDLRNRAQFVMIPVFYILAVILFPLGIGPETGTLSLIAPGILVVSSLFASLLALEKLFSSDISDGSFESIILCPVPISVIMAGKITAHWILTGLPLALITPFLAIMLGLSFEIALFSSLIILLITIILSLIGAMIASLVINTGKGSVLLALLSFPLFIPVLIFAAGAIDLAIIGGIGNSIAPILFLCSLTSIALPVVPIICAAIIKWQVR